MTFERKRLKEHSPSCVFHLNIKNLLTLKTKGIFVVVILRVMWGTTQSPVIEVTLTLTVRIVFPRLAAAEQASRARTEQAVAALEERDGSHGTFCLLLAGVMGGGGGGRAGAAAGLAGGAARTVLMAAGRRRTRARRTESDTAGDGPTSLFLLSERNPIRRMTKFFQAARRWRIGVFLLIAVR